MYYIIYLILIWVVVAFIYSKVKYEPFLKSFILMPFFILKILFSIPLSYGNIKAEARKQGRKDVLKKINDVEKKQDKVKKDINRTINEIKKY